MKPNYPPEIQTVLAHLHKAGHSAYIVGGALRDALLGRTAHDWDVTTSARPEETARVFSAFRVIKTGIKHGTVTVLVNGMPVEITTFRIDGEYRDARHPEAVTFTACVNEDLARRDFTVNAMAYSPQEGLVDLFDGQGDLRRRIIRAVGDPALRFSEDALRILRAFRFVSKLDFEMDADTLAAARETRMGLRQVSAERITAELCELLEGIAPARALTAMMENGIFEAIAPHFRPAVEGIGLIERLPADFGMRMAAFLKDCDDRGESLLGCLRLSNKSAARIRSYLALREFQWTRVDEPFVRRFLAAAGRFADDLIPLVEVGFFDLGEGDRRRVAKSIQAIRSRGDCLSPGELAVNGRHLLAIGVSGAEVGRILAALYEAVLNDPSKNQEDILMKMAADLRYKRIDK